VAFRCMFMMRVLMVDFGIFMLTYENLSNCCASLETCPTSQKNLQIYHNDKFTLYFHRHRVIAHDPYIYIYIYICLQWLQLANCEIQYFQEWISLTFNLVVNWRFLVAWSPSFWRSVSIWETDTIIVGKTTCAVEEKTSHNGQHFFSPGWSRANAFCFLQST
jgi:hypothetical protein